MGKPLKRHPALIPLSQDHHFGLLLGWKIRRGIKKEVEKDRIVKYLDYYVSSHLEPHFQLEERFIFSFLAKNDLMRKEAEQQHVDLRNSVDRILSGSENAFADLEQFAEALDAHIRFEERKLFQHMQVELTEEDLAELESRVKRIHEKIKENWKDQFWEN
ncbi:hemerythrin domain-containing protein [Negadavirga shengliensis]|uniref:Hemerythrin domain-containing protein n=1 Tax=Negadavirga shengliensis TaxID=1389218 RepID=A0ABV9SYZ7_9BACT